VITASVFFLKKGDYCLYGSEKGNWLLAIGWISGGCSYMKFRTKNLNLGCVCFSLFGCDLVPGKVVRMTSSFSRQEPRAKIFDQITKIFQR